jgi:hypothetical protein
MDITQVAPETYVDIFAAPGSPDAGPKPMTANFGASNHNVDIFNSSTTDTTTAAVQDSTTDTTTVAASTTDTTTINTDILGVDDTNKGKDKAPKPDFNFSSYFEDRVRGGKFVAIKEQAEDGTEKFFIPKTAEEFDEVLELQVNHRLSQEKQNLDKQWYQSKSPAWQAVAQYAELTDDPSEILPFIEGVRVMESVKDIDPATPEGAETIVRLRLEQKGDSADVIEEQVEVLKTADKLLSTAQKYKPLILEEERAQLAQMVQEREAEEQEYNNMVLSIRDGAIKAIESPIFGKQVLRQDEKAAVYSLIAIPSEETKGYPIYTAIDNLFREGDFETLKQVALFLSKKDSFIKYIASSAANATAADLQKKLRVATDHRPASGNDDGRGADANPSIQRPKYTGRFGR